MIRHESLPRPLRHVRSWMREYARAWEQQFDALDRYLQKAQRQAERSQSEHPSSEQESR